jgi:hypothetical protein
MHDGPVHDPSPVLLSSAADRRAAVRLASERKASERRSELIGFRAASVGIVTPCAMA